MKQVVGFLFVLIGLLCAGCGHEETPAVNLFFTSDIEGVFWSRPEPRYGNEVTGGLSVLKAFLDKQTLPFILLEGGNWFSQTPEGNLSQGGYFNTAAATLPYAGRLFTEKDLVYGWPSLSHMMKDSPAPFILSNVQTAQGQQPAGSRPWLLKEAGGVKVGIFGLVSTHAAHGKQRVNGLKVTDEIAAARQTVQLLRDKGAQVVVLMSALGSPEDETALTDAGLAEEVSGMDIILSSNLGREQAETDRVGKTLIVYPGSKLDGVGRVSLFMNKDGSLASARFEDVVLYRRDWGEDAAVAEQVAQVRRTARGQMGRVAGKLDQGLSGRLDAESDLGDFVADCLRKWARSDAAVVYSDSLRGDLPAGNITQYDLYKLYPYADNVTYLTIKGSALRQALEEGLSLPGNFAQISGLQVRYNPALPAGKRILSLQVNGNAFSPSATYRVAVTDHALSGGAGHDGFIDSLEFKNTQVEVRTVLRLCLAGNKPVPAPQGSRWKEIKK